MTDITNDQINIFLKITEEIMKGDLMDIRVKNIEHSIEDQINEINQGVKT